MDLDKVMEEEEINSISREDAIELYNLMIDYFEKRKYTNGAFINFLSFAIISTLESNDVSFEFIKKTTENMLNKFKEIRKKRDNERKHS
jgi:hypothetical protein